MNNQQTTLRVWLLVMIAMIIIQILIGGITRLTDSGLSITEWEVVKGVLPPLSETAWQENFEKYKQIPQYEQLHPDMNLSEFKFIYFWEWIHRFWGRLIGMAIILPFIFLWIRGKLTDFAKKRMFLGLVLIGIVGSFGWIMVASGLGEDAWLWVDAYRLTAHLILAMITLAYFVWVYLEVTKGKQNYYPPEIQNKGAAWILIVLTVLQLLLGGMMSGTKAGRIYKTFPDMNGYFIPPEMHASEINAVAFTNYQYDATLATLVQFLHRMSGYALLAFIIWFFVKYRKQATDAGLKKGILWMHIFAFLQLVIGIGALLHGHPDVPVSFGVMHQMGAILLLISVVYVFYHSQNDEKLVA